MVVFFCSVFSHPLSRRDMPRFEGFSDSEVDRYTVSRTEHAFKDLVTILQTALRHEGSPRWNRILNTYFPTETDVELQKTTTSAIRDMITNILSNKAALKDATASSHVGEDLSTAVGMITISAHDFNKLDHISITYFDRSNRNMRLSPEWTELADLTERGQSKCAYLGNKVSDRMETAAAVLFHELTYVISP